MTGSPRAASKRQWEVLLPVGVAAAFILVTGLLVLRLGTDRAQQQRERIDDHATNLQYALETRLLGDRDFLVLLAHEAARGALTPDTFQTRVSEYVRAHPGLINVTWADATHVIRWTAPYEPNKQVIGLPLDLPEPRRASRAAAETGLPVWTQPFEVIQGQPAFEVYVPIVRDGTFTGTLGGVFGCNPLLHAFESDLGHRHPEMEVTLRRADGATVARVGNIPETDPARAFPIELTALGTGMTLIVTPAHSPLWFSTTGWLAVVAMGLAIGLAWSLRVARGYIVERLRAVDALQQSEERYQSIVDDVRFGVLIHRGATPLFANAAVADLTGFAPAELLTLGILDLVAPEYRAEVATYTQAQLADEPVPPVHQLDILRKDGTRRRMEVTRARIMFEGEPAVMTTLLDITERERAEEERARLAAAIEQAAETIIITDPEGTIEYVNPAFEGTTGYTRTEALGRNPRMLRSGQHTASFYTDMWDALRRGDTWRGRFTNRRKDGTLFQEDAVISPVRDAAGTIVRYVAVKMDVTEQIALQRQLLQAQKMEAIGTLAGGIAHDFNNLLTGVLGGMELALMALPEDAPAAGDIREARAAAERGAELTQQLLTLSRRREPVFGPVDVATVLQDTVHLLYRSIPESIGVEAVVDETLPLIRADATQVQQALLNLGINARDAMPDGGRLTFRAAQVTVEPGHTAEEAQMPPGEFVRISVVDTGHGMAPDIMDRVFEPFFTTKEQGRGTGLGLAMVYACAEAHEGWVTVTSEVGVGTTFHLYLPARAIEAPAAPAPRVPEYARGTETILLIEDAQDVRRVGRSLLERLGYTVLPAADGREALEIYRANAGSIDLVLTDLVMPRSGGRDVLRQLREAGAAIPIIACSGYTRDASADVLLAEGFAAFVGKPFQLATLSQTLRQILDTTTVPRRTT